MRRTLKATALVATPALLTVGMLAACDDNETMETAGGPQVAVTSPRSPAPAPSCEAAQTDKFDPEHDGFLPGSRRVPVR
jgi:hypothetical protein